MKLERIIAVRTSKTVYKQDDKVVKLFDERYSKADVLNEALNQARVEETGLNIPRLLEVTKLEGKWAIIMEHIPGITLEELIRRNPESADGYMELFVDLHREIHNKRVPLMGKLKDKLKYKIASTDLIATMRYELQTRLDAMPRHEQLCHGDFNPSNIIINENGTAYILDWSHATLGEAMADVARTYLLFWMKGDITGAEKYLDMYCQKEDTDKHEVLRWIPLVAAARLAEGKKVEREFLLHWIDVVEYE